MPAPHPVEFRQRAVELARMREKPVAEIAADLGISDSCLRGWMRQADLDDGPDRLWVMDVTEHRTGDGKVYLAAGVLGSIGSIGDAFDHSVGRGVLLEPATRTA